MATGTQERTKRVTTTENITVLQVGEYGVRVGEKLWFGVNEPLTPQHFVPNTGYKVSVTTSKTGKKYICEIIGTEDKGAGTDATSVSDEVKSAEAALAKAKADAALKAPVAGEAAKGALTKEGYWERKEAKDEAVGMLRCRSAAFSAALSSPFLGQLATNVDEYLALVRKAADMAVKYVNE